MRGILVADQYVFAENAKSSVTERSPEAQVKLYIHYPKAILTEAGAEAPRGFALENCKESDGAI